MLKSDLHNEIGPTSLGHADFMVTVMLISDALSQDFQSASTAQVEYGGPGYQKHRKTTARQAVQVGDFKNMKFIDI